MTKYHCGAIGCLGHTYIFEECFGSIKPMSFKCGKLGCSGHITAFEKCF